VGCVTSPRAELPPLDVSLREACQRPSLITPPADLGTMTQRAIENAQLLHECELRRAGVVEAYDQIRGQQKGGR
jgi:hypothetical protein